jgi:hypothetical protein
VNTTIQGATVFLAAAASLLASALDTAALAKECAPPRKFEGFCTQVVVWAKDPRTGACCRYADPCSVPKGYQVYHRSGCGKRVSPQFGSHPIGGSAAARV